MAEQRHERPARLMQHVSNDDLEVSIGPLLGAMAAVGFTLVAAMILVIVMSL